MSTFPPPIQTGLPWDQLEPADRAERWNALCEWIEWFVRRYPIEEITPCWHLHPAVVDELTALWTAHAGAHYPGVPPNSPLGWLEQLERALPRLRRWAGSCTPVDHRPQPRPSWITDVDRFLGAERAGPPPTNPLDADDPARSLVGPGARR